MNPAPPTPSLPAHVRFVRALAAELCRYRGPHHAEALQLVRLCRLWDSVAAQASGPDGQLAEGLAANILRAVEAAAGRLRLGAA